MFWVKSKDGITFAPINKIDHLCADYCESTDKWSLQAVTCSGKKLYIKSFSNHRDISEVVDEVLAAWKKGEQANSEYEI